jgi:hypothetical protein
MCETGGSPGALLAEGKRIEAPFTVLDERGPEATLECRRCGYEFDVNAYTGENLIIDQQTRMHRAVCPLCGTVEK